MGRDLNKQISDSRRDARIINNRTTSRLVVPLVDLSEGNDYKIDIRLCKLLADNNS